MSYKIIVDTSAKTLSSAIRQTGNFFTETGMPQLVLGDSRIYRLAFYDMQTMQLEPWSGHEDYILQVGIGTCAAPTEGTFTLEFDGETTAAISVNALPAAVQSALEDLSNIGEGNVKVTGVAGLWRIEFIGALADTNVAQIAGDVSTATPDSRVIALTLQQGGGGNNEVQTIQLQQTLLSYQDTWTKYTDGEEIGWEGTLSTASLELALRIQESDGVQSVMEIKVIDPNGNARTYVKRGVEILCRIINPGAFIPSPLPEVPTMAQVLALLAGYAEKNGSNITDPNNWRDKVYGQNTVVLDDDYEIPDDAGAYLSLDPDGADRTITAHADVRQVFITHNGASHALDLDALYTGLTLRPGDSAALVWDSVAEEFVLVGGSIAPVTTRVDTSGSAPFFSTSAGPLVHGIVPASITIPYPGKWRIGYSVSVAGNGATFSGTVSTWLMRTNNTLAVVSGTTTVSKQDITTSSVTLSHAGQTDVVYTTLTAGDTIELWGELSTGVGAGNIDLDAASITLERMGD